MQPKTTQPMGTDLVAVVVYASKKKEHVSADSGQTQIKVSFVKKKIKIFERNRTLPLLFIWYQNTFAFMHEVIRRQLIMQLPHPPHVLVLTDLSGTTCAVLSFKCSLKASHWQSSQLFSHKTYERNLQLHCFLWVKPQQ